MQLEGYVKAKTTEGMSTTTRPKMAPGVVTDLPTPLVPNPCVLSHHELTCVCLIDLFITVSKLHY